jgi:predicted lipid-binding transport protein (Tim44 family)
MSGAIAWLSALRARHPHLLPTLGLAALTLAVTALLLLDPGAAWARVGGGQSYGGHSRSSSSGGGGGGGDGDLIWLLLWLCIEHPALGIPLTVIVIAVVLVKARMNRRWGDGTSFRAQPHPAAHRPRVRAWDLRGLQASDANFSEPAFLDFAQVVYTRCQHERIGGRMERVAAYLSPQARAALAGRMAATSVHDVIIGATRLVRGRVGPQGLEVLVEFEANLTETRGGQDVQLLVTERWTFQKRAGALSPSPDRLVALVCPNCGNPAETRPDGRCAHCDTPIGQGRLLWLVSDCRLLAEEPIKPPPLALFTGEEAGTDLPTIHDPGLAAQVRAFQTRYPDFDLLQFKARVREVFLSLQQAWSEGRWELARPHQTDHVFQQHRYWLERYARYGLRNRLEDVEVLQIDLVRLTADAFYESATLRIKARMRDYTLDGAGAVVGGSRTRLRTFSEYWTFIRSAAKPTTRKGDTHHCPACGAPLDRVSETGVCGYCGAKIASGSHDWVLSAIAQDEAYEG